MGGLLLIMRWLMLFGGKDMSAFKGFSVFQSVPFDDDCSSLMITRALAFIYLDLG